MAGASPRRPGGPRRGRRRAPIPPRVLNAGPGLTPQQRQQIAQAGQLAQQLGIGRGTGGAGAAGPPPPPAPPGAPPPPPPGGGGGGRRRAGGGPGVGQAGGRARGAGNFAQQPAPPNAPSRGPRPGAGAAPPRTWEELAAYVNDPLPDPGTPEAVTELERGDLARARLEQKDLADLSRAERARRASRPYRVAAGVVNALPGGLVDRVERLPTPGGLFALIAALLFFLFAIVPSGPQGQTRLELVWRALTGGAQLPATARGANRQASTLEASSALAGASAAESYAQQAEQLGGTLWQSFWATQGG